MAAGTVSVLKTSRGRSAAQDGGVWCVLVLFAVAIGLTLRAAGPAAARTAFDQVSPDSMAAVASLLAACFLSTALHECGHLAAALLFRFDLLGGSLGPFRATRLRGSWQFQISGRNLFHGSVAAVPEVAGRWRAATMAVVAAGPLATLLAGVLSVFAIADQPGTHPFWSAMAVLNLLLFALSLIPFQIKAAPSDARLFVALLRNNREAADIARCFRLMRERALTPADTSCAA